MSLAAPMIAPDQVETSTERRIYYGWVNLLMASVAIMIGELAIVVKLPSRKMTSEAGMT